MKHKKLTDCGEFFAILEDIGARCVGFRSGFARIHDPAHMGGFAEQSPAPKRGMTHTPCGGVCAAFASQGVCISLHDFKIMFEPGLPRVIPTGKGASHLGMFFWGSPLSCRPES